MEPQRVICRCRRFTFAAGFLIAAFLFIALLWAQHRSMYYGGIASSRATGLASVSGGFDNPMALLSSGSLADVLFQATFSRGGISAQPGEPGDQDPTIVKSGHLQT